MKCLLCESKLISKQALYKHVFNFTSISDQLCKNNIIIKVHTIVKIMCDNEVDLFITVNAMIHNNTDLLIQLNWRDLTHEANGPAEIQLYNSRNHNALIGTYVVNDLQGSILTEHSFAISANIDEPTHYFALYKRQNAIFALYMFRNRARYCQELRYFIGPQRIDQVAWVGAHDAGAVTVFHPETSNFMQWWYELYTTQRLSPMQMCIQGVRYFDIRLEIQADESLGDRRFKIIHGPVYTGSFLDFFIELVRFVRLTNEPIIIDFHEVCLQDFCRQDEQYEMERLGELFERHAPGLLHFSQYVPTINEIWNSGHLIVVSSPNPIFRQHFLVFSIEQIWANAGDVGILMEYFETILRVENAFNGVKSLNVAITRSYLRHPNTGLREYAQRVNSILNYKILEPNWVKNLNILSLDFILSSRAVDLIYDLNKARFTIF